MFIRGSMRSRANTQPLFVVDGTPIDNSTFSTDRAALRISADSTTDPPIKT